MKTKQVLLMPAKHGFAGIAGLSKGLVLATATLVFLWTANYAQNANVVPVNTELTAANVKNGLIGISIKAPGGNAANFTAQNFAVKDENGRTTDVSIKNTIINGDYLLITLDASNLGISSYSTVNDGNPNDPKPQGGKMSLIGTLKEITIDNVSGVSENNDPGATFIQVVDPSTIVDYTGALDGASPAMSGGSGTGNSGNNTGGSRSDGIITKDEVQGLVSAFPNPAHGSVSLRTSNPNLEIKEVVLINAIGAKLVVKSVDQNESRLVKIDTDSFPAGVYFLSVKTNFGDTVKRIVLVN